MVKKVDIKQNTKVKQKQNVNVRVNIDQRDTKKKPRKKRNNRPSVKRDGVSSFSSTGFTPVYIQSGNPYPIPPVPDATPIKVPIQQREVSSLVNPPVTSTTNLINEAKQKVKERPNEREENRSMGNEDINVAFRRLPNNIQNSIIQRQNNMDANDMEISEVNSNNIVAIPREKRKYTKKNEEFWYNKKYRRGGI